MQKVILLFSYLICHMLSSCSSNLTINHPTSMQKEGVILLHGLSRSPKSMLHIQSFLTKRGFMVQNVGYPSTSAPLKELMHYLTKPIGLLQKEGCSSVHFVSHSMGGILIRVYKKHYPSTPMGRVVMLGPPNQGSEVVDVLRKTWIFSFINGPAGAELGTESTSTVNSLGPVDFELGVIAGDRSVNWIQSLFMLPGPDDGKVTVENTKVAGMKSHIIMHTTHTFMTFKKSVIFQIANFLEHGEFK